MHALLDGFFAAHGVNLDAEPTPDAVRAMQRLLDGVPERWRDAEVAWWPAIRPRRRDSCAHLYRRDDLHIAPSADRPRPAHLAGFRRIADAAPMTTA
jgi:hypothetical protein